MGLYLGGFGHKCMHDAPYCTLFLQILSKLNLGNSLYIFSCAIIKNNNVHVLCSCY